MELIFTTEEKANELDDTTTSLRPSVRCSNIVGLIKAYLPLLELHKLLAQEAPPQPLSRLQCAGALKHIPKILHTLAPDDPEHNNDDKIPKHKSGGESEDSGARSLAILCLDPTRGFIAPPALCEGHLVRFVRSLFGFLLTCI